MSTRPISLVAFTVLLLASASRLSAQSGIRLILWHAEGVRLSDGPTALYGIGFDRNLNDRLSMGVEVLGDPDVSVFTFRYRSAFHFSDNDDDGGSGYFGPMVAISSVAKGAGSSIVLPVGARLGFRGTLPGVFLDLYGGFQYQAGAPPKDAESTHVDAPAPFSYLFGIDFGFGVSGKKDRD